MPVSLNIWLYSRIFCYSPVELSVTPEKNESHFFHERGLALNGQLVKEDAVVKSYEDGG